MSESIKQVQIRVKDVFKLYVSLQHEGHENVVISNGPKITMHNNQVVLTEQYEQVTDLIQSIANIFEEHLLLGLTFQTIIIYILKKNKQSVPQSLQWLQLLYDQRIVKASPSTPVYLFKDTQELVRQCLNRSCLIELIEFIAKHLEPHVEQFYVLERSPLFLGDDLVMQFKTLLQPIQNTVKFLIKEPTPPQATSKADANSASSSGGASSKDAQKKKKKKKKNIVSFGDDEEQPVNEDDDDVLVVSQQRKKTKKKKSSTSTTIATTQQQQQQDDASSKQSTDASPSPLLARHLNDNFHTLDDHQENLLADDALDKEQIEREEREWGAPIVTAKAQPMQQERTIAQNLELVDSIIQRQEAQRALKEQEEQQELQQQVKQVEPKEEATIVKQEEAIVVEQVQQQQQEEVSIAAVPSLLSTLQGNIVSYFTGSSSPASQTKAVVQQAEQQATNTSSSFLVERVDMNEQQDDNVKEEEETVNQVVNSVQEAAPAAPAPAAPAAIQQEEHSNEQVKPTASITITTTTSIADSVEQLEEPSNSGNEITNSSKEEDIESTIKETMQVLVEQAVDKAIASSQEEVEATTRTIPLTSHTVEQEEEEPITGITNPPLLVDKATSHTNPIATSNEDTNISQVHQVEEEESSNLSSKQEELKSSSLVVLPTASKPTSVDNDNQFEIEDELFESATEIDEQAIVPQSPRQEYTSQEELVPPLVTPVAVVTPVAALTPVAAVTPVAVAAQEAVAVAAQEAAADAPKQPSVQQDNNEDNYNSDVDHQVVQHEELPTTITTLVKPKKQPNVHSKPHILHGTLFSIKKQSLHKIVQAEELIAANNNRPRTIHKHMFTADEPVDLLVGAELVKLIDRYFNSFDIATSLQLNMKTCGRGGDGDYGDDDDDDNNNISVSDEFLEYKSELQAKRERLINILERKSHRLLLQAERNKKQQEADEHDDKRRLLLLEEMVTKYASNEDTWCRIAAKSSDLLQYRQELQSIKSELAQREEAIQKREEALAKKMLEFSQQASQQQQQQQQQKQQAMVANNNNNRMPNVPTLSQLHQQQQQQQKQQAANNSTLVIQRQPVIANSPSVAAIGASPSSSLLTKAAAAAAATTTSTTLQASVAVPINGAQKQQQNNSFKNSNASSLANSANSNYDDTTVTATATAADDDDDDEAADENLQSNGSNGIPVLVRQASNSTSSSNTTKLQEANSIHVNNTPQSTPPKSSSQVEGGEWQYLSSSPSILQNFNNHHIQSPALSSSNTITSMLPPPAPVPAPVPVPPQPVLFNNNKNNNSKPPPPLPSSSSSSLVVAASPPQGSIKLPEQLPNYSISTYEVTRSGRHMKLLVDKIEQRLDSSKLVNAQMQQQKGACPLCEKQLNKDYGYFKKPRVCYYTQKVYCMDCHKNETSVIPSFIIHDWDFKQYPVCNVVKNYLTEIMTHPVFVLSAINPSLFDKNSNLRKARMIRARLMMQWEIMEDCPRNSSVLQKLNLHNNTYLLMDTETYSLQNILDLNHAADHSPFLKQLASIFHAFSQHITSQCQYCKTKSALQCSKCYDNEPIFAFNLTNVIQCNRCKKAFHKECFRNEKSVKACPFCSSASSASTQALSTSPSN